MTAQRIIRPDTAFSLDGSRRQKRPRAHDNQHLDFIRRLPCIVSGRRDAVDAAHIRYADPRYGKRAVGMQEKPDDKYTLPLHHDLHMNQHASNEQQWWAEKGIDPVQVAVALYQCSGDEETAEVILNEARKRARQP